MRRIYTKVIVGAALLVARSGCGTISNLNGEQPWLIGPPPKHSITPFGGVDNDVRVLSRATAIGLRTRCRGRRNTAYASPRRTRLAAGLNRRSCGSSLGSGPTADVGRAIGDPPNMPAGPGQWAPVGRTGPDIKVPLAEWDLHRKPQSHNQPGAVKSHQANDRATG